MNRNHIGLYEELLQSQSLPLTPILSLKLSKFVKKRARTCKQRKKLSEDVRFCSRKREKLVHIISLNFFAFKNVFFFLYRPLSDSSLIATSGSRVSSRIPLFFFIVRSWKTGIAGVASLEKTSRSLTPFLLRNNFQTCKKYQSNVRMKNDDKKKDCLPHIRSTIFTSRLVFGETEMNLASNFHVLYSSDATHMQLKSDRIKRNANNNPTEHMNSMLWIFIDTFQLSLVICRVYFWYKHSLSKI